MKSSNIRFIHKKIADSGKVLDSGDVKKGKKIYFRIMRRYLLMSPLEQKAVYHEVLNEYNRRKKLEKNLLGILYKQGKKKEAHSFEEEIKKEEEELKKLMDKVKRLKILFKPSYIAVFLVIVINFYLLLDLILGLRVTSSLNIGQRTDLTAAIIAVPLIAVVFIFLFLLATSKNLRKMMFKSSKEFFVDRLLPLVGFWIVLFFLVAFITLLILNNVSSEFKEGGGFSFFSVPMQVIFALGVLLFIVLMAIAPRWIAGDLRKFTIKKLLSGEQHKEFKQTITPVFIKSWQADLSGNQDKKTDARVKKLIKRIEHDINDKSIYKNLDSVLSIIIDVRDLLKKGKIDKARQLYDMIMEKAKVLKPEFRKLVYSLVEDIDVELSKRNASA